jgi:hypothetical protein
LEESKKRVGAPSITFVGDVSGSMQPNMQALLNSVLALIDLSGTGSTLRVILFDETARTVLPFTRVTSANCQQLKEHLKYSIVNNGKSTNLELALKAVLSPSELKESSSQPDTDPRQSTSQSSTLPEYQDEERSLTLFASDGLANLGRHSSADLLTYARSFQSYSQQTFYTLGIKTDPFALLNSELLKDLALDSCGSFCLTEHSEGIAQSIGDVLADHYFVQYTQVKFECKISN